MRLHVLVIGCILGVVLSGILTSFMIPVHDDTHISFPRLPDFSAIKSTRKHSNKDSDERADNSLFVSNNTDAIAAPTTSQCPLWKPEQRQVLLVAFHPEKTAGTTMARFFELQEQVNGGNFEMMSPWDETWLLQWLGDSDFRASHPRVFVHLHGKGSFYANRAFRRESVLEAVVGLPQKIQDVLQADSVDPTATGFFEYLLKLLSMHSPRLELEGTRVLAVPSWC